MNKDMAYWDVQNKGYLKAQAEVRGYRFTTLETMGKRTDVNGKLVKVAGAKPFMKADYLRVLKTLL